MENYQSGSMTENNSLTERTGQTRASAAHRTNLVGQENSAEQVGFATTGQTRASAAHHNSLTERTGQFVETAGVSTYANSVEQANIVGQVNHVEQAQLADQALLVADVSFAWMQTSDDTSGENYHYLNSGTCPDCHAAMVRLGSCFSCPCCGWSSCAV